MVTQGYTHEQNQRAMDGKESVWNNARNTVIITLPPKKDVPLRTAAICFITRLTNGAIQLMKIVRFQTQAEGRSCMRKLNVLEKVCHRILCGNHHLFQELLYYGM